MDKASCKVQSSGDAPLSLEDVRKNPFCLDTADISTFPFCPRVIVTNEPLAPLSPEVRVQYVAEPDITKIRRFFSALRPLTVLIDWTAALITSLILIRAMRKPGAVGLISLGKRSGSLFCFLQSFKKFQGGPVTAYRALLPARAGRLKRCLIGRALRNTAVTAVWSRTQIENYSLTFAIPPEKFIFMPYKANHSRSARKPLEIGNYIFSGGNSERDYRTLFAAVEGLPVSVIISITRRRVIRGLSIPENVIVVGAEEPFFERLMAGARMVVLCLREDMIRGSGEATLLNAMWHGKPVVAADSISSCDYIQNGVEGFVVPAGSVSEARKRILEILENPELAARMGAAGRARVTGFYTHAHYKKRMQILAMLAGGQQSSGAGVSKPPDV